MTEAGFFAQKNSSPGGLALVILLHGAVFAALILIKAPQFLREMHPRTVIDFIEVPPEPPIDTPPPTPVDQPVQPVRERIDQVQQEVQTNSGQQVSQGEQVTRFADNSGTGDIVVPPRQPLPPLPVRHGAQVDPRYAGDLQPPYPPSEQRAQRDGRVQVRVTIGPDGRVVAIALLSATSDAFWRVTQQQALRRWRFRPATVDGRPVEDSKVMNLVFRITDAG
ncbi:MAG: periplasmic protein TonB [Sphingomonadales bacterium]|nr:periplasmic protein TonB [Sphingomonadales bacterium]